MGLTTREMQHKGLSRNQAVKLHKFHGEVTMEHVKREILQNGKWRGKIVPSVHAIKHSKSTQK